MKREMITGSEALEKSDDVLNIVNSNAGGPYGSAVLKDVEKASNDVWNQVE